MLSQCDEQIIPSALQNRALSPLTTPLTPSEFLIPIRQLIQKMYTQNHHQQPNRDHNQQREPQPTQHHRARPDSTPYTPVPEILRHLRRRDGRRVLPEHADEHEDGRDEDEGERDLRDGARGEGLDVDVGAGAGVVFFVPAGESCEEQEGYEGEDYGDDSTSCVSA